MTPRFPLGFRPTGIRFSDHPVLVRSWAFIASGLPNRGPDLNRVSTFRSFEMRLGWAPS